MEPDPLPTDPLLLRYRQIIGRDFGRYRNHVRRVFANCLLLDDRPENEQKYAVAAVFHDLGIWTDRTFDYLQPSIEQASTYLEETGKSEWIEVVTLMIDMHHKWSRYRGPYADVVETFRKADWIDVSFGLKNFGLDRQAIQTNRKIYPNLGFHLFLLRSTLKYALRHPFQNPLPMFRS